jgi:hypothetical protein
MTWIISSFIVYSKNGVTQYVQRSDGASIPPDPNNTDYAAFLEVDTDAKLCTRVEIPDPVPDPTPSDKERISALEDAIIALSGV